MKIIFPRVILGNRGDIASRWALLSALQRIENAQIDAVFAHTPKDIPNEIIQKLPYLPLKNVFPSFSGLKSFLKADLVVWGVGLDFQDDASLMKLLYLKVQFSLYRFLGLRIWCFFQGAGPILTSSGHKLAHSVLKEVELFVTRDPATLKLLKSINDQPQYILGHDAIFLPGLEDDASKISKDDRGWIDNLTKGIQHPVVGFNIRLWFHFSSSVLPFELSKEHYLERANKKMEKLVQAAVENIRYLRTAFQARILLISAYQPDTVSWEDDNQWLQLIKSHFINDPEVILVDQYMSMPSYFQFMAQLDLAIGMRLHTTLIGLRMGVPSINLNYTLKGKDILEHLGLPNYTVGLEEFIDTPDILKPKIMSILGNLSSERKYVDKAVQVAIKENEAILKEIFEK
jgi:polysaccharide pyruvyl transferase WcaK-like protein